MTNTYLSESELIRKCPFGHSILSFPDTLNYKDVFWSLNQVSRNLKEDNKYHAEFQGNSNGTVKYELCFDYIITPQKHICNITRLFDKIANVNCIHNA